MLWRGIEPMAGITSGHASTSRMVGRALSASGWPARTASTSGSGPSDSEPEAFHRGGVVHAADDEVEHVGLEQVDQRAVHAGLHGQRHLGVRGAELRDGVEQQRRHDARQRAQPDAFVARGIGAGQAVRRRVHVLDDAQRMAQEAHAGRGQVRAGALAHQQPGADQFLEFGQRLGHRRLGQAQPRTGPAQVLGLRHGDEAAQVPQPDAGAEQIGRRIRCIHN